MRMSCHIGINLVAGVSVALLLCSHFICIHGQEPETAVITEAPQNTRARVGTNVTFTCSGNGEIIWIFGGIEVRSPGRVASLAREGIFVPLGLRGFSQAVVTATLELNMSELRFISCQVKTGDLLGGFDTVNSEQVSLSVYVGAVITRAPRNIRASVGRNVTFTCRGNGEIVWVVGGVQVRSSLRASLLADEGIFVEVGKRSFSRLVMTASINLNMSDLNSVTCRVEVGDIVSGVDAVDSEEISLFVFENNLEVYFVSNTPAVTSDRIYAEIESNRPGVSLQCQLLRSQDNTREDCSSGCYEKNGVPAGDYVLRIVAREPTNPQERRVLRKKLSIPKDDEFCIIGLWNRGLTVSGSSATFDFYSIGEPTRFQCVLDQGDIIEDCTSPHTIGNLTSGLHHFRITPLDCGRRFTPLTMQFDI